MASAHAQTLTHFHMAFYTHSHTCVHTGAVLPSRVLHPYLHPRRRHCHRHQHRHLYLFLLPLLLPGFLCDAAVEAVPCAAQPHHQPQRQRQPQFQPQHTARTGTGILRLLKRLTRMTRSILAASIGPVNGVAVSAEYAMTALCRRPMEVRVVTIVHSAMTMSIVVI